MQSVNEAEAIIYSLVQPLDSQLDTETVDLLGATGRILAKPITSPNDFPHWDNSAMDGYAVRYEDVSDCNALNPAVLSIIEEIPAGYQPKSTLQPGQAARIFTGAVIPPGTDTIVMQEVTQRENNQVFIFAAPKPKEFIRKKASYYQAGNELLPAGIVLNAPEIAVLAAAQCNQLCVYRKVKVAILSTGDELVTVDKTLQPGQIVDSNNYALIANVQQLGAEAISYGIVPDDEEILKATIEKAVSKSSGGADIIISSGGVSVGEYDYVEKILELLGGKLHIRSVAMKPGKPLTVAAFPNNKIYFGLPGNPASALVTFWRFVQPVLKKLSGLSENWQPAIIKAKASTELRSDGKRETYIWGKLKLINGEYEFEIAGGNQVSGNLINLAQTNALAIIPEATKSILPGQQVNVLIVGAS
ncbi:molybdopterin molybdenumtransferase MoeA [Dulcicalothrix desertica PCC 7102]|uniref:Molybdopterin molybdenumtransferase n=1 Tax=Dulcicalothrix desertica PCC 7102 TaxID=232991 RepID=A0A433V8Y5_9CYAN|nr:gephyrin-like molybdotransferase Glp [Dulcicalothrix desertica]RUT02570.1 molybdopterin molybdenumtransferase MoeA [Dulcicalothrix desertica PCC 7102]TWH55215.1 molybdopterin molybdotransferase [Dulcicalothrix desertica PCC 7102]